MDKEKRKIYQDKEKFIEIKLASIKDTIALLPKRLVKPQKI